MGYKFIRAIEYTPTSSAGHSLSCLMKLMYESWCYCVNGGASPTTPGGLAATTPSTLPTNFTEGTSVLATGTDGVTTISSSQLFTSASASFATTVVGKHLVAWKPGSGSTDDSIYMIRARPSATQLVVESRNGGTPDPITQRPTFTNRTGIVYRIIDLPSVMGLGADGQYMVFQMNGSSVNAGQANSQIQFFRRSTGLSLGVVVSPAGTWNGSVFTDGTTEVTGSFFAGGSTGTGYCTIIADPAALLMHITGGGFGSGCFHFEIPLRLYTQAQDPNPITWSLQAPTNFFNTGNGAGSMGITMRLVGTDNVLRTANMVVRSLAGDGQNATHPTVPGVTMTSSGPSLNPITGKAMSSEAMLVTLATSQYAFARVKLRAVRIAGQYYPSFMRFGDFGEWIHIQNGVYWPWDNSILPFNLFPAGIP